MGMKNSKAFDNDSKDTGGEKTRRSRGRRRRVVKEDYNQHKISAWEKHAKGSACAVVKVEGLVSKDLRIIKDKPDGSAVYYIYNKPNDSSIEMKENENGTMTDEFGNECPRQGFYVPTMENDDGTEELLVHWNPNKTLKENLSGQHYIINHGSTDVTDTDCMILQIGYGHEQDEERRREVIEDLQNPAIGFEWEVQFFKKFTNVTATEKDIFILNQNRRIEFYSWKEIKTKKAVFEKLNPCLSLYYQINPKEFGTFYTELL